MVVLAGQEAFEQERSSASVAVADEVKLLGL